MKSRTIRLIALTTLTLVTFACGGLVPGGFRSGPPPNAVIVEVMANTSLEIWLQSAVEAFNRSEAQTAAGRPVWAALNPVEAGQAVVEIAGGASPTLWIPDDPVWAELLAAQGETSYSTDCVSVAGSPLVIAMWRPVAESLGWPGRELGWLDIGSLAADPSAWAYYSGGQFGESLRLGHTHPGLSASGTATLLAVVQAAQSQTEPVTPQDIQEPIVQASVGAFEGAVSWFSSSTAELAATMRERGPGFLDAAVMYESDALVHGEGEFAAIYPFEGTYLATHPACVDGSADLESQEGALILRNFLLDESSQLLAAEAGLRPVAAGATTGQYAFDPERPKTTFGSPTVESVLAIQNVWVSARKPVNLVMLLDVSGSMEGNKIASLRSAAVQFVNQMGEDDFLTLIVFSDQPQLVIDHAPVGELRSRAVQEIEQLIADGNTTLYDAIGLGAQVIARTDSSRTSNALVVLTDGQDTASEHYRLGPELINLAANNDTTVFTIAYGSDAEEELLSDLAFRANGNFYRGDEASIAQIYNEMSAAFGGAVGIGR